MSARATRRRALANVFLHGGHRRRRLGNSSFSRRAIRIRQPGAGSLAHRRVGRGKVLVRRSRRPDLIASSFKVSGWHLALVGSCVTLLAAAYGFPSVTFTDAGPDWHDR